MSRRSVRDYAGFLEFLWRLGDRTCDVVDLTETVICGHADDGRALMPKLAVSLGAFDTKEIMSHRLFDLARPLTTDERARHRNDWARLRSENAPLRIVTPDLTLASAPLDYFDAALLSHMREGHWLKAARIIGEVMMQSWHTDIFQADDWFLASRLVALAAARRIESQGNLWSIGHSEVRLPQAEPVSA
jgi:hypothetical protein